MTPSSEPKKVFVAATGQDQGKTTVSLGLMSAFRELCPPVGFIKPVGQRYVEVHGVRVDEDVALMREIFPADCALADMSPVTVGRSFTRDYIRDPHRQEIVERIREAFQRMSAGMSSVVIEGTGHAGVGSCFDTSNADVAKLLGAKVILVAGGGIGKPIDEVLLNESLFHDRGVELIGVVLNKVLPSKLEENREIVATGLGRKNIDLLGCIPFEPRLASPSVRQVLDEIGGELLNGEASLGNSIGSVIVGAMAAHRALEYIIPGCLLITPGDRDDLILAAMSICTMGAGPKDQVAGILLTGGAGPQKTVLDLVRRTEIPVILVKSDSYTAAAAVNDLKVKIQPTDTTKTLLATQLIRQHVNVQRIVERL
jgi:BioD-like phosphotransacetylase family protein